MTALRSPDVTAAVIGALSAALDAPVSMSVPRNRPAAFVTVQLAGGHRPNAVTGSPMLTVQAWAANAPAAYTLAADAEAVAFDLAGSTTGGVWVRAVSQVGGIQFFPDPESDTPRCQFTIALNVRLS